MKQPMCSVPCTRVFYCIWFLPIILGVASCASNTSLSRVIHDPDKYLGDKWQDQPEYVSAIEDTRDPTLEEVVRNLIAIVPGDSNLVWDEDKRHVLMVSLVSKKAMDVYADSIGMAIHAKGEIWVTAVPELKDKCRSNAIKELLN